MRIYTRTGDKGESGLYGGERRPKDDAVFDLLGSLDELNAALGVARSEGAGFELDPLMARVQSVLFDLGAEVAVPPDNPKFLPAPLEGLTEELERSMDAADEALPPLDSFVLPGGCKLAADLHLARAICRRTERALVAHARTTDVRPNTLGFLNRLSDWLFVAARLANVRAGTPDVFWSR